MAVFQVDFMAESLGRTVPIIVILPTDKVYFPGMPRREEGKPFKTLYLLHGIVGDCTDWLYGTRIRRWAEERDLCVVMPSGDNAFYLDEDAGAYLWYGGDDLWNYQLYPAQRIVLSTGTSGWAGLLHENKVYAWDESGRQLNHLSDLFLKRHLGKQRAQCFVCHMHPP